MDFCRLIFNQLFVLIFSKFCSINTTGWERESIQEFVRSTLVSTCRSVHTKMTGLRRLFYDDSALKPPTNSSFMVDLNADGRHDFRTTRALSDREEAQLSNAGISTWSSSTMTPAEMARHLLSPSNALTSVIRQPLKITRTLTQLAHRVGHYLTLTGNAEGYWDAYRFDKLAAGQAAVSSIGRFMSELNKFVEALSELREGRLSVDLLSPLVGSSALKRLMQSLSAQGISSLVEKGSDLYQLKVSAVGFASGVVDALIHVPAQRQTLVLTAYEYVPSPLRLAPHRYVRPVPEQTVIVTNPERTLFRSTTLASLNQCSEINGLRVCEIDHFLEKRDDEDCLQNLFLADSEGIVRSCRMTVFPPEDYLVQLTPADFLLYQKEKTDLTVTCPDSGATRFTYSGLRHVRLPEGCLGDSLSFKFEGAPLTPSSPFLSGTVQVAAHWNGSMPELGELDQVLAVLVDQHEETGEPMTFDSLLEEVDERSNQRLRSILVMIASILSGIYTVVQSGWWLCKPVVRRRRSASAAGEADLPPGIEMVSAGTSMTLHNQGDRTALYPPVNNYDEKPLPPSPKSSAVQSATV